MHTNASLSNHDTSTTMTKEIVKVRSEQSLGSAEQHDEEGLTPSSIPATQTETLLPQWYPHWRGKPFYNGNIQSLGWALDSVGRAVAFIGAAAFLGTALLRLAKEAAGCETEPPPGEHKVPECNERVYGFRPSSLLTTYTVVVGIFSATLMPLMGAIVDYTPHRRLAGRWFSVAITLMLFPQIFLSDKTWFPIALLQMGVAFAGWAQTMVTYAYLPELTQSEEELTAFTESFSIVTFGSMVTYLAGVVAVATLFGWSDDVSTARLGQAVSFCVSALCLYPAWGFMFQRRPAARALPEGQSLWTAGFIQVYRTGRTIIREYKALQWFYLSVALVDAGINSLATIMITYLTDTLLFSSTQNAAAVLTMLLGSIPGAWVARQTATRGTPVSSAIWAAALLATNTVIAASVLKSPGQEVETFVMAFLWGVGTGWKWTVDRLLASVLLPASQDNHGHAELMGVYLFCGQVLTWLPPLVFTALNEAGVSQRIGIGSLAVLFVTGGMALFLIGDYQAATNPREQDARTSDVLETSELETVAEG